jgi:hypothetical protein
MFRCSPPSVPTLREVRRPWLCSCHRSVVDRREHHAVVFAGEDAGYGLTSHVHYLPDTFQGIVRRANDPKSG